MAHDESNVKVSFIGEHYAINLLTATLIKSDPLVYIIPLFLSFKKTIYSSQFDFKIWSVYQ